MILGNMLLPAFLDRVLAKIAVGAQQAAQPVTAERVDNLISPVGPLHRTRGRFGREAQDSALVVSGPAFRMLPVLIGGAVLLAMGFVTGASSTRPRPAQRARRFPRPYHRLN
jgi:hypothetical protein